jgi:hypothetical protein
MVQENRGRMKGWFKLALVVSLLALVGMVVGGCGEAGPEAAVRGLFKALEAQDAAKVGEYLTEDLRASMVPQMEFAFSGIDSVNYRNLKLTVVSQTEDKATVEAEYELELKMHDETEKFENTDTLRLARVDGKWLISEID